MGNESQMNWLSKTKSERELDRLQKIYGQLKTTNEDVTPIWRTSVRLSCGAANRISSPRCSIARVLGNQYSKQNMAAAPGMTSNANIGTDKTPLVLKGRVYGNHRSLQNVQTIQAQRQQQQQQRCDNSVSSILNTPASFGNYYNLKNRLILLDEQRAALMQLYGRDRFLNEYTDLLQQCWHFEQVHKNVLPFAQAKIQAMLAEMENCTVSNVVEQKHTAVKRPATPVVKAVDRRKASSISAAQNSTKSPFSTQSSATKSTGKIIPKITDPAEHCGPSAVNPEQPSIGLVKRNACSKLIDLDETVTTKNCSQIGSLLDIQRSAAVGGLVVAQTDNGHPSNYSIAASLHQAPSVFERETNLLPLSGDLSPCRSALDNVISHSNLPEKVDHPEFISTEKQNVETVSPVLAVSKSGTRNIEDFEINQQDQLSHLNDRSGFNIADTPNLENKMASSDYLTRSSIFAQVGEPEKDCTNPVQCLSLDKQRENQERDIVTDQETFKPAENKNLASATSDATSLPQMQSNSSNLPVPNLSFVRNLVNQFSNNLM